MIFSTLLFGLPVHTLHLNCPVNRVLFSIKYIPTRCQPTNPFKRFSSAFPWPRPPATWPSRVPLFSYTRGTALAHPSMFGKAVIFVHTPLFIIRFTRHRHVRSSRARNAYVGRYTTRLSQVTEIPVAGFLRPNSGTDCGPIGPSNSNGSLTGFCPVGPSENTFDRRHRDWLVFHGISGIIT